VFRRAWDVLNKYKAERLVISSMVDGGKVHFSHKVKPRPSKARRHVIGFRVVHVEKTHLQIDPRQKSLIHPYQCVAIHKHMQCDPQINPHKSTNK